jgi:hypothetical protein
MMLASSRRTCGVSGHLATLTLAGMCEWVYGPLTLVRVMCVCVCV